MRKIMLATAMIASFVFGPPISAEDLTSNGAQLTDMANLPKQGLVTYHGTFDLSGGYTGTTGDVQVFVDFATGNVSADLTIPQLGSGGGASLPQHYTPTGVISRHGKKAGYTLTQGLFFSPTMPFISLSGTFIGPRALNTVGTFKTSFCVPDSSDPACSGAIYIIREVSGTFSATRGSAPPS
jgi:hypothetical protein